MESMDSFLVGKGDTIRFYDINTYLERTGVAIEVPLIKSETREPSEIIGLQKSHDENTIAVISGKNLQKSEQFINQLFIFTRNTNPVDPSSDTFTLAHRHVLKDITEINVEFTAMNFHFKLPENGTDPHTIIFARKDRLYELDYHTSKVTDKVIF